MTAFSLPPTTRPSFHRRLLSFPSFTTSLLLLWFILFTLQVSAQSILNNTLWYPTNQILTWGNNEFNRCGYPYISSSNTPIRNLRFEHLAFNNTYSYNPVNNHFGQSSSLDVHASPITVADGFSFKMVLVHYLNSSGGFVNETIFGCGDNGNNQLGK